MMRAFLYLLIVIFTFSLGVSQTEYSRGCLTTLPFQKEHCGLHEDSESEKNHSLRVALSNASSSVGYRVKVAVHVLYHSDSISQNISTNQVESQIRILNEDFRRTNSDATNTPSDFVSVASDTRIEFELDTIIRIETSKSLWNAVTASNTIGPDYDDMKSTSSGGSSPLNTSEYLNIWVCQLSNGLLGYAQFPPSYYSNPSLNTDGVVLDFRTVGDIGLLFSVYNKGRTATHEVGHWLGLFHTWGDGGCSVDDAIDDTPVCSGSSSIAEKPSCLGPGDQCGQGNRMVENYMDYSHDECMNLFTNGQGVVMRSSLVNDRSAVYEEFIIPQPSYSYDKDFIEIGDTVTYISDDVESDSLFWFFEGGIPDTVYNDTIVKVVYENKGNYDVSLTVYDEFDRSFSLSLENLIEVEETIPDNIEEIDGDNPLIYPNPSPDNVYYILTNDDKSRKIILSNSQGGLVFEKEYLPESQVDIDLNGLEKGMYFLNITSESGTITKRLMKL